MYNPRKAAKLESMNYPGKAAKLEAKADHFTHLPDPAISKIVSLLTLKEAVRTSILAKRWKYEWINHTDLVFDSVNILGSKVYSNNISSFKPESERQRQRRRFIKIVDQLMNKRSLGLKMDSLNIRFHLGKEFSSYINKWISLAVEKDVESLNLDLSERSCFRKRDVRSDHQLELYTFPSSILFSRDQKSSLKNLKLAFCCLSTLPSSINLASLITIELREVNINDQELADFLSVCSSLETLTLHFCNNLMDLKLSCSSSKFKLLRIQDCRRLNSIEVNSKSLNTVDYTGVFIRFYFRNSPKLKKVFLNFTNENRAEGISYALTRFAHDTPQLESLNIHSVLTMKMLNLPEQVPCFTNIKQLILTVFPFNDEDELQWISFILKAFPLLEELELNLFSPNYIRGVKETNRELPECSHKHLRKLEIYGFYGNPHEIDLLTYLLKSVVLLEVLVINLSRKIYRRVDLWEFEDSTSWYGVQRQETIQRLHRLVPSYVELTIQ